MNITVQASFQISAWKIETRDIYCNLHKLKSFADSVSINSAEMYCRFWTASALLSQLSPWWGNKCKCWISKKQWEKYYLMVWKKFVGSRFFDFGSDSSSSLQNLLVFVTGFAIFEDISVSLQMLVDTILRDKSRSIGLSTNSPLLVDLEERLCLFLGKQKVMQEMATAIKLDREELLGDSGTNGTDELGGSVPSSSSWDSLMSSSGLWNDK